jgi:DNA replication protein DnaD
MEGWISLHRQLQEHWLWKSKEPFDKRSAWIDLLLMVNHQKEKVEFDKGFIEVERGQRITSLEKLSKRWRWSRHKVSDYLNQLEQDGMLVQVRDNKKTLISIENYDKYQIQKEVLDMSEDMQKVRSRTGKGHKQ